MLPAGRPSMRKELQGLGGVGGWCPSQQGSLSIAQPDPQGQQRVKWGEMEQLPPCNQHSGWR